MSARDAVARTGRLQRCAYGVVTLTIAALSSGCVLGDNLTCNNRQARQAIAEAATNSLAAAVSVPASQREAPTNPLTLHDTFEVSRQGDVLSCHGTLGPKRPDKVTPDFPLDYQITRSNDGNLLYNFDADHFGRAFVALTILNAINSQAKADNSTEQSSSALAGLGEPPEPPNKSSASVEQSETWADSVRQKVNEQVSSFPIEGSGTVSVEFDILPAGDLANVRVVRSSGDAKLDATAVQIVQRAAHVAEPPSHQLVKFSMKLAFL